MGEKIKEKPMNGTLTCEGQYLKSKSKAMTKK